MLSARCPPGGHLVGGAAAQDVDDVTDAPALAGPNDRRQDLLGERQRVADTLQLLEAPVAGVAGWALEGLAEVLHQHTVATAGASRVALDVAQQPSRVLRQLSALLQHLSPPGEVGAGVEQDALGLQPVAAGPARLLLVVLERARCTGVDDIPDVRAVDAHAERHGGDHDVGPLLEKRLLMTAAHLVRQPCVVGQGAMTQPVEPARHVLDLPARHAVDDAGLTCMPFQHAADLILEPGAGQHPVHEIRPVERADQHLGIAQRQLGGDVVAHLPGRGGGEGVDGDLGQVVAETGQPPELRTELVTPLTDAVSLVDRHELDTPCAEPSAKRLGPLADQPLRGDVEQPASSGVEVGVDLAPLGRAERAVERRGRDPACHETIDLVLHQRDERRDDETETVGRPHQRRHLEAQRLAAARGQHDDAVASVEVSRDRGALHGTELAVAPVPDQRVIQDGLVHESGPIRLHRYTWADANGSLRRPTVLPSPWPDDRARSATSSTSRPRSGC